MGVWTWLPSCCSQPEGTELPHHRLSNPRAERTKALQLLKSQSCSLYPMPYVPLFLRHATSKLPSPLVYIPIKGEEGR